METPTHLLVTTHTLHQTGLSGCEDLPEGLTVVWMWAGSTLPHPESPASLEI